MSRRHVVLLGDSIFDNGAYIKPGEPDVCTQLQQLYPEVDKVTRCAVDGAITASIPAQIERLPSDATHLVVSMGGNNALSDMVVLTGEQTTIIAALEKFSGIMSRFRADYAAALTAIRAVKLPTLVCTIYRPRFTEPQMQHIGAVGLALYNDIIISSAVEAHLPLLDLRLVCNDDADFANEIEPSAAGGAKMSAAIKRVLDSHDFGLNNSVIYV